MGPWGLIPVEQNKQLKKSQMPMASFKLTCMCARWGEREGTKGRRTLLVCKLFLSSNPSPENELQDGLGILSSSGFVSWSFNKC